MVVPLEFGIDGAGLMTEALLHMRIALDLLDRSRAPADIGAYLDLAMVKLQDAIPAEAKPSSLANRPTRFHQTFSTQLPNLLIHPDRT